MTMIDIHVAKTHLLRLVEEAAAGKEIIIAKAGKPIAKLGPLAAKSGRSKRRLGLLAGRVKLPKDFDAPLLSDILESFEGRSPLQR